MTEIIEQSNDLVDPQTGQSATGASDLKAKAVHYFREKASIYNERYDVKAAGDLLWVRHRAVLQLIIQSGLPKGSRFLDLGCGPGVMARELERLGYSGVGLDSSPAMVHRCTEKAIPHAANSWSFQHGDVEALPFPDNSFDGAVCMGVVDYLSTDDKLLSEVARVVRPGGTFVLCFTNKFGYTVSLSRLLYLVKKFRPIRALASKLRSVLVGGEQGAMEFDFLPRKHVPWATRISMQGHGFRTVQDRYVHFTLLPAPFCAITSKLGLGIDERLSALDRTPLRYFGSCYITSTRLEK